MTAPGTGANDGVHSFDYQATDNAGNPSTTGACTVKIDTQPPQTTRPTCSRNARPAGRRASQVVHSDPDRPAARAGGTYYTLDGGARQTYTAPFTVSGRGSHKVVYWSVDKLGNTETPAAGYVNIDTVPPVTTPTASPPPAPRPGRTRHSR